MLVFFFVVLILLLNCVFSVSDSSLVVLSSGFFTSLFPLMKGKSVNVCLRLVLLSDVTVAQAPCHAALISNERARRRSLT